MVISIRVIVNIVRSMVLIIMKFFDFGLNKVVDSILKIRILVFEFDNVEGIYNFVFFGKKSY